MTPCQIRFSPDLTDDAKQRWQQILHHHHIAHHPNANLIVLCHHDHLAVGLQDMPTLGMIHATFDDPHHQHRLRTLRFGRNPLAKAIGSSTTPLKILDATAGWGEDSFVLYHLGHHVVSVEKHPILAFILANNIAQHCRNHPRQNTWHAQCGHHLDVLQHHSDPWDVVYFDMMFGAKQHHAKSPKKMAFLQSLLPMEPLSEDAWHLACQHSQRIVIKEAANGRRTQHPLHFLPHKPTFQVKSKTCRFNIYECRHTD